MEGIKSNFLQRGVNNYNVAQFIKKFNIKIVRSYRKI